MTNEWIKNGTKISGKYCGVQFSGVVTNSRAHTMNHRQLLHIELESPIVVFSTERTYLCEVEISDIAA